MSLPTIVLKNQFGEESTNEVMAGTTIPGISPIAAHTVLMNNTAGSAEAAGVTVQNTSNALPAKAGVQSIGAESAAGGTTIALSTANTYTDAAVNTAVNAALVTMTAQLNAAITNLNAILAALKVVS